MCHSEVASLLEKEGHFNGGVKRPSCYIENALFETLLNEFDRPPENQTQMNQKSLFRISSQGLKKAAIVTEMLVYIQHLDKKKRSASVREMYYRLRHLVKIKTMKMASNSCIVVVEKEAVFQSLVELIWEVKDSPFIFMTGKGYPDMTTRRFLKHLIETQGLDAYYLGDYDPHGIAIYLVYCFGANHLESQNAGSRLFRDELCVVFQHFESNILGCRSLKWLGLHSHDVQNLPKEVFKPLGQRETLLLKGIALNMKTQNFSLVNHEVQFMEKMHRKCELEALYQYGRRYILDELIGRKIVLEHSGTKKLPGLCVDS